MKYTIEEIAIGDEVYFESTELQRNHDLNWKVIHIYESQKELVVQLDEMGHRDLRWTISISEVKYHLPIGQSNSSTR